MFILSLLPLRWKQYKAETDMKRSIAHLPKRKQDDLYFLVKKKMIILYGRWEGMWSMTKG